MNPAKVAAVTVLAGTLSIGIALYGERLFEDAGGEPGAGNGTEEQLNTLPDLRLPDLTGREIASNSWAGRVVVLHWWATWCVPCVQQLAVLADLQTTHGKGALQVVGIAIDTPDEVARFIAEQPVDYPILLGGIEAIDVARRLGNRTDGLPFTVVFDAVGHRVFSQAGELQPTELQTTLAPLLPVDAG